MLPFSSVPWSGILLGIAAFSAGLSPCVLPAAVVTRDAINQGRFNSDGQHTLSYNSFTGYLSPRQYRSFFVFDLGSLAGTINSANLLLELTSYLNLDINQPPNPTLTFDVFDVSTTPAVLDAFYDFNDATGIDIFNDLGTGNIYATRSVIATDVGSVLNIPLNPLALADVENNLGGSFVVGLRLSDPDTATHLINFGEALLNDANSPFAQLQLDLTPPLPDPDPPDPVGETPAMPEPASNLAWLGMLWLVRRRRQRHTR